MSGYPSLISPLMDEQGLILTEALNQDAQTALALSATNEADIIVLQETALQLSGDPATYTGLPNTNTSLNGDLQMNSNNVTGVDEITSDVVNGNTINVKNVDSTNYYSITGNLAGIQVGANIVCGDNITCNTLNYTALNPPISGGSQNIEEVLIVGNNANEKSISNLTNVDTRTLSSPLGYINAPSIVLPTGSLTCRNASSNGVIETNAIRIFSDAITYSAVLSTEGTVFAKSYQMFDQTPSKFSVSNAGTLFTTKLEIDETLADSSSSVGTAGQVLSSTGTGIQWVSPSGGSQSLGDVMTVGNTASTDLNMDNNDITTVASIGITNGTTNVIQEVSSTSQALEFLTEFGYATLKCDTILSEYATVGTTEGQQVLLSNIGEVRCSSLNIPSDALTPAFSITNDGIAFTTKLEIGETLADASSSVGTAGQLLSSTGTATAWVDAPSSATPTLGDVLTAGNTASTLLDMNNNTLDNAFSVYTKSLYSVNNLEGGNIFSNNLTIQDGTGTAKLSITPSGSLVDATLSSGTAGQLLSSTGTATAWVDAPVSATPTLGDVMTAGNTASTDLNMNSNDITGVVDIGCATVTATGQIKGRTIKSDEEAKEDAFSNKLSTFRVLQNGQVFGTNGNFSEGLEITSGVVQLGTGNVYMSNNKVSVSEATGNITTSGLFNGTNINYRPSYDYFVAKNGSDSNPGSILSPFLTIQKAIDVCEAFTDNVPRNINIFYGVYSQSLIISKSRIALNGANMGGSRSDSGCSINGSITIDVSSGLSDLNNNNIYFNNLLINGSITDTSSIVHRVSIKDCYLYGTSSVLTFNPSADYRLFVDYSYLNNEDTVSTDALVSCGGTGMVSFTSNQMTSKCKGHVVSITCRVDTFVLNVLTNVNAGDDVLAICKLGSSVDTTAYTLGQNAFIYSSTTGKSSTAPYFSCGILMDTPAAKTNFLTIISNTFVMTGLNNSSTNFAVTGTLISTSSVYVFYGNNTAISSSIAPYSFQINSAAGFVKNALLAVQ